MEKIKFFENTENIDKLTSFIKKLKQIETDDEFEKIRNDNIYQIINSMKNNSSLWDNYCQINI
ncbi:hypothetical protein [Aliarcobacter butzleri]|uniref:hypothetical protein n=1 Tax=Aliarcobacter butzleri TaxID=28197 RepID=UPI00125F5FF3|nr:hypothetical protein [Aliarcobacter butzleri]MCG3655414.1 hypothetical protein [Aliarcobacter butzleri]MCT7571429.1 hypothetical protein [Aliarcobacter butzleri]MCT7622757.1 hypothetical protein [Aliarcobacter butzleri]